MEPQLKENLFERFLHNIQPFKSKVSVYRELSHNMLKDPEISLKKFDFIYIDASHTSINALRDAVLTFPLLKVLGVIAFDDNGSVEVKKEIDAFLDIYEVLTE